MEQHTGEERGRPRQRDQSVRRLVQIFNSDTHEIVETKTFENPCDYWNPGTLIEEYSLRGQRLIVKTKITRRSYGLWCTPPWPTPKRHPHWQKRRREGRRIKTLLLGSPGMLDETVSSVGRFTTAPAKCVHR